MLRSRGNRLPRVSQPLSFFLPLRPVSSRSRSFPIASSILSSFLSLSNAERAQAVSLPFHHSGSSCVYIYATACLFRSTSFPPFSFSHSPPYLTVRFFPLRLFPSFPFLVSPEDRVHTHTRVRVCAMRDIRQVHRSSLFLFLFLLLPFHSARRSISLSLSRVAVVPPLLIFISFSSRFVVAELLTGHRTHPTHCS